jgi:signal transduction histidine kinase
LDDRIKKLINVTHQLTEGNYNVEVPVTPMDEMGQLGKALQELANSLEVHYQELARLNRLTAQINSGLLLDQILDELYRDFHAIIPYNRIGLALLEEGGRVLRSRWVKTDRELVRLGPSYSAKMAGSSLQGILESRQPRILNHLDDYLAQKPESASTRLVIEEGYLSSLTCPLVANGVPVGFIFFSSAAANTYEKVHVEVFQQIAEQLSVIVEKGRLVSDLAEKTNRIEQQNEELRRLNYLKNVFLGMAVHDLRNPIANIQLTTDVMLNMGGGQLTQEEMTDFLKDINHQSRYMALLITDILNAVEIEAGKIRLTLIETDLAGFLSEAVKRHNKLAEVKGTHVILDGEPGGKLMADRGRLRQVVDNLISNAVKYSPRGSTVRVRAVHPEESWRIEVQDEGPGIAEKDRNRLFMDFSRLSARPTGGEKSTGLGLAISRRLVEAHNGQIGVDSSPGQGATFWFTIPDPA